MGIFENIFRRQTDSNHQELTSPITSYQVENVEDGVIEFIIANLKSDKPKKSLLKQIESKVIFGRNCAYADCFVYELFFPSELEERFRDSAKKINAIKDLNNDPNSNTITQTGNIEGIDYNHIKIVLPKGIGYAEIPKQLNLILKGIVGD